MADVDPDDGPLVNPPVELMAGLSNVNSLLETASIVLTVTDASNNVFMDAVDLHLIVVAESHVVVSHLKLFIISYFRLCMFLSYFEYPVDIDIEVSENP